MLRKHVFRKHAVHQGRREQRTCGIRMIYTSHYSAVPPRVEVGGGGRWLEIDCRMQGREILLTLAVGWRHSVVKGKEAGHFYEVDGVSIVAVPSPLSVVDTFNIRHPSGLNLNILTEFFFRRLEEKQKNIFVSFVRPGHIYIS